MKKAFVGFAGFGGVDIALHESGYDVIGVELDDSIAAVARINGHNTITANILDIDPLNYTNWDLMHFSPPCPNFSLAKNDRAETELDLALARKIADFITIATPEIFTLENVYQYRLSQSWDIIANALANSGYGFEFWHLNSADYGVPQTRRRMIVIARRDGRKPAKPFPTHYNKRAGSIGKGAIPIFGKPWRGWYEAIEDLIPTLPESSFADWQLKRLPKGFGFSFYAGSGRNTIRQSTQRKANGPAVTVTATDMRRPISVPKAFLVATGNTNKDDAKPGRGILYDDQPASTVFTMQSNGSIPKAFITSGDGKLAIKTDDEPLTTLVASETNQRGIKAFLYDRLNASGNLTTRSSDEPSFTLTVYSPKHQPPNAFAQGRVVSMTPRALARFQSFPDSYKLPDNNKLACKGIGNAVPVGLYRAVLGSI